MFAGKVVLVTGGTSGIGLALARAFLAAGARVTVCGRDPRRLEVARASLPGVTASRCDVTDAGQVRRLLAEVEAGFGRLDVLVSNAGSLAERDLAAGVDPAEVEREVRLNLVAPIVLTGLAMPLLKKAERAAIVVVTSGYALAPATRAPVYSAAKAGLRAFAKALRRQVRPLGMTVTEVVPPVVDTPAVAHLAVRKVSPEAVAAATLRAVAAGRSEVYVGVARLLPLLLRLAPGLAEAAVART